jgi:hypothetical protein
VWYNEAELDLDLISKIKRGAVSAVAAHGNVATPAQVRSSGGDGCDATPGYCRLRSLIRIPLR